MNSVCGAADNCFLAFLWAQARERLVSLFEIANSRGGAASANGIRPREHGFELDELLLAEVHRVRTNRAFEVANQRARHADAAAYAHSLAGAPGAQPDTG